MRVIVSFSEVERATGELLRDGLRRAVVAPFYRLESLPFGSQIRIGRVAGVALMSVALLVDAVRFWFRRSGEHRRQPRCECIAQHGSVRLQGPVANSR